MLPVENLSEEKFAGENGSGKIYERKISLTSSNDEIYTARLITVRLKKKTRDNDTEIHLVTNIPEEKADALTVAEIYHYLKHFILQCIQNVLHSAEPVHSSDILSGHDPIH